MSDYTSMGSAETIFTRGGEDLHVWRDPQDVNSHHDNLEDTRKDIIKFKSSLAIELEVKSATESFVNKIRYDKDEQLVTSSPDTVEIMFRNQQSCTWPWQFAPSEWFRSFCRCLDVRNGPCNPTNK